VHPLARQRTPCANRRHARCRPPARRNAPPRGEHNVNPPGGRVRPPALPAIGPAPAQRRGAAAEDLACAFLRRQGLRIADRNVRYRAGEIDVVAIDGATWVFVEVRARARAGEAAASIDARKRGKIRRAAQLYLAGRFGDRWPPCRFDVVAVTGRQVQWLPSAFSGDEEC